MNPSLRQSLWALMLLLDLRFGSLWARLRVLRWHHILRVLFLISLAAIVFFGIYRAELFILAYLMGIPELGKLVDRKSTRLNSSHLA